MHPNGQQYKKCWITEEFETSKTAWVTKRGHKINTMERKMELMPKSTLEDNEDKHVDLFFTNGEVYSGTFAGMDGEEIMLDAEKSGHRIGLPMNMLKNYAIEV